MIRSATGRAFMAVRDMDVAASVIGIAMMKTKLLAFAISSFYCGVAAHSMRSATWARSSPRLSPRPELSCAVHGHYRRRRLGLGILPGAAFITLFPILLNVSGGVVADSLGIGLSHAVLSNLEVMIFAV